MRTYSWHSTGGSLNDQYDVTVKVSSLATVSGAPSSVTVTTPVVDMGAAAKVTPSRYPSIGTLEWRASNSPFSPGDSSPAWSSPTGEYRYWQARVTWTDSTRLLERIEFATPFLALEFVMLRNRFIWEAHTNQNPVTVPFRPIAWSHRVSSIQQVAVGYQVTFAEQADEYWLLLQE
ncbi:MAG: hypothetical protein WHX60_08570 [Armatimonadota bacterium]